MSNQPNRPDEPTGRPRMPRFPGRSGQPGGQMSWPSDPGARAGAPRNGLAVAALIVGIVSIPAALVLGVIDVVLILAAIILGVLALQRVRQGVSDKRGVAIAGIVTAVVGLILAIVLTVIGYRNLQNCKKQLHLKGTPTTAQLKQCQKTK